MNLTWKRFDDQLLSAPSKRSGEKYVIVTDNAGMWMATRMAGYRAGIDHLGFHYTLDAAQRACADREAQS